MTNVTYSSGCMDQAGCSADLPMREPLLSICIPTYNRAAYLLECLKSIVGQIESLCRDDIEIVVSDNDSHDETQEVVRSLSSQSPNIRYFKNDRNVGATRNLALAVERAKGKYVWFCADDDLIEEKAIDKIIRTLTDHPEVALIFLSRQEWNADFSESINPHTVGIWEDQYCKLGTDLYVIKGKSSVAGLLGYISSLVFVRKAWLDSLESHAMDSADMFGQLRVVLTFIRAYPCYYVGHPYIKTRIGTQRDYHVSLSKTLFKDFNEAYNYALSLGYSPLVTYEIKKELLQSAWRVLITDKAKGEQPYTLSQIRKIAGIPLRQYPFMFVLSIAIYRVCPPGLLPVVYRLYRSYKDKSLYPNVAPR